MVIYLNDEIILKNNKVRIFRPYEIRKIVGAIPKNNYKDKFETLLYTGARYAEIKRLHNHPRWFKGEYIVMPSFKPKAKQKERYIRLNSPGQRSVQYFLRDPQGLPTSVTWYENMKRWCDIAGLDTMGVCIKSLRKTWESWLVTKYPKQLEHIFLSQGHSGMVALKYYLMLPFTDQDKSDMGYYIDGWI